MYERSAIVLERYFENLLEYRRECNLKDNFNNYCDLVEKLEKYQINYEKELAATQEFNESVRKVRLVQASQEKLYKKSVKLEYNRNLLFNNIEGKVEDTRKCIEKIEEEVEKNNEAMKESKENLIVALEEYNEKRFELSKCKRYKKMAENAYNDSYEASSTNYEGITNELLDLLKNFAKFEDSEDIIAELDDNGKNEKIPFNQEVMENATLFAIEIAKKEAVGYSVLYDKMTKLLTDIEAGATKIELHKKYARNEKAKMDFLLAVKNYIIQFLDYERMTVIHGRKSHNRLMSEACENFAADIVQINNLFELLVREIANKATKKAYKELYNKSYLMDIQEKEEKFKKEKNKVNLNTATLINSNYWRIEGIREIYTIFYKTVTEVLGKNVDEFDMLKTEEYDENQDDFVVEEVEEKEEKEVAKIPFEIGGRSKINEIQDEYEIEDNDFSDEDEEQEDETNDAEENESYEDDDFESNDEEMDDESEDVEERLYSDTYDAIIDNVVEEFQEGFDDDDEFDIFGEKYKEIDFSDTIDIKAKKNLEEVEELKEESIIPFEEEDDEIVDIKPVTRQRKSKNDIEDEILTEEATTNTLFKKMKKISSVKKKKAESDIW